jgi:hypothetical protein
MKTSRAAFVLFTVLVSHPFPSHSSESNSFISVDGKTSYRFENITRTLRKENKTHNEIEVVQTTFSIFARTAGLPEEHKIDSVTFPECNAETGAWEDSCLQGKIVFPTTQISDFFYVDHYIRGQLQPRYLATILYFLDGNVWKHRSLDKAYESILDADKNGEHIIYQVWDTGCCSWANESNDLTYVRQRRQVKDIFNERKRFKNPNYDVSFYTKGARFSPDYRNIAVTISHYGDYDPKTNAPIRLSSSGKDNPEELAAIMADLRELPRVEILSPDRPEKILAAFPQSDFVKWIDAEQFVIKNGGKETVQKLSLKR